jgi:hypothetical protein
VASTLQNVGAIAAIVAASVVVATALWQIGRWWWRRRNVRGVKARVFVSGENLYLGVTGLPSWTATFTAFVDEGANPQKRLGPAAYRPDIYPDEQLLNMREGNQPLDDAAEKYRVEIVADSLGSDPRRVFKGSLRIK